MSEAKKAAASDAAEPKIVTEGLDPQVMAALKTEMAAKEKAHEEAQQREADEAKAKLAAEEQERADMEAIGRSFMETLTIVTSEPDWKDWAPADDPVELVTDMLAMIDELKAGPPVEPLPEGARTTPLAWDELAPLSVAGTIDLAAWVIEGAEMSFVMKTEPYHRNVPENWGIFNGASDGTHQAIIAYSIERRPTAEVLFNKLRELGEISGTFEDLLPVQRASFELAARILPAVADVVEVMNAEMVRRNPPVSPATAAQLVDIEDTILERVDGIDDIDPQMAAAREKADQEAAKREAEKKPTKAKKRSIADKTDE